MKYTTLFLLGLCAAPLLRAQSIGPASVNATGGSRQIAGNTYEYAIGDGVFTPAFVGPGLVVTPGVLQPTDEDPNSIQPPGIDAGALALFPNPAQDVLLLQPRFGKKGNLHYLLYDGLGRVILQKDCSLQTGNERQEIHLQALSVGQYTLRVAWTAADGRYVSAYKIQKIK